MTVNLPPVLASSLLNGKTVLVTADIALGRLIDGNFFNFSSAYFNASALYNSPISANLNPSQINQVLIWDGSQWTASTAPIVGVTDHGALTGLVDNDHPQYVLVTTNTSLSSLVSTHVANTSNPHNVTAQQVGNTISQWDASALNGFAISLLSEPPPGTFLIWNGAAWVASSVTIVPPVTDHGALTGLADNDHPQYVLVTTNLNLSTDFFTHRDNISNPHSVTPAQVGNITSQWNASALRSTALSATLVPTSQQILVYNGSVWTASTIPGLAGGGEANTASNDTVSTAVGIFDRKSGVDLVFRPIYGSGAITVSVPTSGGVEYVNLYVNNTLAQWNANQIQGYDVNDQTPVFNDIWYYNGVEWQPISWSSLIAYATPMWNANKLYSTNIDPNVSDSGPGQVLTWDGSKWTPSSVTGGSGETNDGSNIGNGNGIYAGKSGVTLQFRSVSGLPNVIGIFSATDSLTLSANYTSAIWNASALAGYRVAFAGAPTSQQALIYNGSTWVASTLPPFTGASALSGLSDVSSNIQPTQFQVLVWSSTKWTASSIPSVITDHGALTGLGDDDHPQYVLVTTNTNLSSQVSTHIANTSNPHSVTAEQVGNTTAQWNASALLNRPLNSLAVPSTGQGLFYNGTQWTPSSVGNLYPSGPIPTALSSPLHTDISANILPNFGQVLAWSSTLWTASNVGNLYPSGPIPTALSSLLHTDVSTNILPNTGQGLYWNGSKWTASSIPNLYPSGTVDPTQQIWYASALRNTALSSTLVPNTGQGLYWNGSVWTASNVGNLYPSGPIPTALSSPLHTDVSTNILPNFGQVLTWSSTKWTASSIPDLYPSAAVQNTVARWNASALQGRAIDTESIPTNGQVLAWANSTSTWGASSIGNLYPSGPIPTALSSPLHTDVSTNILPNFGQVLTWSSTKWTASSIPNLYPSGVINPKDEIWYASALRNTALSSTLVPTSFQVLTWDGSQWTASNAPGAGGGESNTASNLGSGQGLYRQKAGVDLQFLSLSAVNPHGLLIGSSTNNTTTLEVRNTSSIWSASSLRDNALSTTLVPKVGDCLIYDGNQWTARHLGTRYLEVATSATLGINPDLYDMVIVSALGAACQLLNPQPSSTVDQGSKFIVRIKDDGTARSLTYESTYRAMGNSLPTTTVLGKILYLGFIYNRRDHKWDLIAKAQEA